MTSVERGPGWELRLGDWREVLADVAECDAVITDPPYSARTHSGQRHGRRPSQLTSTGTYASARGIGYGHIGANDVDEVVAKFGPAVRGWFCVQTDSDLANGWRSRLSDEGLTTFAPLPVVQVGMNVRLAGDGPSSWTIWMVVARTKAASRWGTLPGAYIGNPFEPGQNSATAGRRSGVVGSKPLWLMRAIVRDYTKPGDLVVDPFCGGGTTALACVMEGRRCITSEIDPKTFALAAARLRIGYVPDMFTGRTA